MNLVSHGSKGSSAQPPEPSPPAELLLVGGGLQNGLIALAALHRDPLRRVTVVERARALGGNHTWCFHDADVDDASRQWLAPLVSAHWNAHDVFFPTRQRRLTSGYSAVTSSTLNRVVSEALAAAPNARLVTGEAVDVQSGAALLKDGRRLTGELVVDARGPGRVAIDPSTRYQKFVGLVVRVKPGSGPVVPRLMDARVAQTDGFRFMYVLPLSTTELLLEDTYYSDSPALDEAALEGEVLRYAQEHGIVVTDVVRRERGVLPLPLSALPAARLESPLVGGYAGGFLHPTTGYSFPIATRLAEHLASRPAAAAFDAAYCELVQTQRRQARYCVALNRLLFHGSKPEDRWHVLARFYGLPAPTIARFYALQMTFMDRARIVCGRPPKGFLPFTFISKGLAA